MPYNLRVPPKLRKQGWRIKISEKERLEPPHVTIIHKTDRWRWDLRTRAFMDDSPEPSAVPREVLTILESGYHDLALAWDTMYPGNKVGSDQGEGDA